MPARFPLPSDAAIEAAFVEFCTRDFFEFLRAAANRRAPPDGPLSPWEKLAVWLYCTTNGGWFRRINDPMRKGEAVNQSTGIVVSCLWNALDKLPVHEGRTYRGIRVEHLPTFLLDYAIREDEEVQVQWPAFSSSTLDSNQAVSGNVLFIIESNDGRRIGPYADVYDEREVLFAPRSRFRVLGLELTPEKAILNLRQVAPSSASR